MGLELTDDGLSIQTSAEIQAEYEAAFRQAFGNAVNLTAKSIFGQIVGTATEREAIVQNTMLDLFRSWNPITAFTVALDIIAALAGSTRLPATESISLTGKVTGTNGTVIANGKQVKLNATETVWEIINGPYTIPVAGFLGDVNIQAVETGPSEIVGPTAPADWTIVTPVVGWDTFETTGSSVDTLGSDVETDAAFKIRRIRELASAGRATLPSITANNSQVDDVTFARTYENTTLVTDGDGIPGKAINLVVEGGDDQEIADELFASKAAGIEPYGTDVTETVVDSQGQSHSISFDRVTGIAIWIKCVLTTSTSEEDFPATGITTIRDALYNYGIASMDGVGQDVLAYKLIGAVEDTGVPGIDSIAMDVGISSPASGSKVGIGIRKRATYVNSVARIAVTEV